MRYMFKVGKRYYWRGKIGGKKTYIGGLLISIDEKDRALMQDDLGEMWLIPIDKLTEKN